MRLLAKDRTWEHGLKLCQNGVRGNVEEGVPEGRSVEEGLEEKACGRVPGGP